MAARWAEFPGLRQKRKFALGGKPGLVKSRGALDAAVTNRAVQNSESVDSQNGDVWRAVCLSNVNPDCQPCPFPGMAVFILLHKECLSLGLLWFCLPAAMGTLEVTDSVL